MSIITILVHTPSSLFDLFKSPNDLEKQDPLEQDSPHDGPYIF
jgi:hypothetical protein